MNIDERFILAVREYPFLYDTADPGYHDNRKKDKAWQQISESFQGWSAGNQREEHIKIERIETTEECNEIPNAASGITSYTAGTSDPPRSSLHPPVAQSLQEDLHDRKRSSEVYEEDALCAFFKAMEKTVRTFSVPMQIEIKGKISNLINEYELKNYRQQVPE
ncbi:Uncharacterized protein GBIM_08730 [Gryllus bimaculatus]|nr:Uncharacterized protein GBIM_08730 [Gryllus bimaculatus]